MLAFDLETTGLDPRKDSVTCAAVCDPGAGIERVFVFPPGEDHGAKAAEFMRLLDEAPRLCGFNAARFDLEFIQHRLGASADRVRAWRLKLHDVYEGCKLALDVTFPLQALLCANGLGGKTGCGQDAIVLARDGRWDELASYCLNDTARTHEVSSLDLIALPRTRGFFMRRDGSFVQPGAMA